MAFLTIVDSMVLRLQQVLRSRYRVHRVEKLRKRVRLVDRVAEIVDAVIAHQAAVHFDCDN
jgi:hypothetical protein